ncbi:MAG TPA: efflux RND transporter periplasmic adaptor subunit [Polyangiaceae bacterium]|nr:efflux RND transporter periplasmic adaptor subunit [Polyangiaceae bacterium]
MNRTASRGTRQLAAALTAATGCCVLVLTSCNDSRATPTPEARAALRGGEPRDVTLEKVTELPLEQTIDISGTLAPDEEVTLAVKVPGRLASIKVDLASPVQRGQVVAQIEATDYQLRIEQVTASLAQARAQLGLDPATPLSELDVEATALVRQARATLTEAQANLVRARSLAKEGLTTGMELDAAEAVAVRAETTVQSAIEEVRIRRAAVRQRESELALARQQLADTLLRSPTDGVVQERLANVGEFFAAGAPIVKIVRVDPLRLRVAIPEREAQPVVAGQPVHVHVEGDPNTYSGVVARVAPSLDLASRSLLIEADIRNPGTLRPGSFARSSIVVGSKPVPTVPRSAIVTFAGLQKVLTVDNGKAVERTVTTGKVAGARVEILSGIKLGEAVVVRPGSLQQGQPVRIKPGA